MKILAGIVTLVVMAGCVAAVVKVSDKLYQRKRALKIKFISGALRLLIVAVFICAEMYIFGGSDGLGGKILGGSTMIVAVLTFTAQQALGNIISGFSISLSKPIEVGQKVKIVQGSNIIAEGIVKDMSVRHIIITTFDGQSCIVPNSIVDNSVILNTNYEKDVGNFVEFEVGYGTDIEFAKALIVAECSKEPLIIRPVKVSVNRYTANGVVLKLTIWTEHLDDNFAICGRLRESMLKLFIGFGIELPYNHVTIGRLVDTEC